jgi:hypothetical protein
MNPRNMERSYPNSASAKSAKTRREFLSQLMVSTHGITPELADYHVGAMSDSQVEEELELRSTGVFRPEWIAIDSGREL